MALTKVSGSIIKDSVSLSGNVSVGGTLTYQDVTNVDALGIGTFRTGIKVLAGQVDVGSNIKLGNAGVITATSFSGSGANLTGIQVGGASSLSFNDGVGAYFGGSQDLQILHTGSKSIINDTGAGQLELQVGGSTKFNTQSGGAQFYGTLYADDNNKIELGNDQDLKLYHDGNDSYIDDAGVGSLLLRTTNNSTVAIKNSSANMARFLAGDAVELYYDNLKMLETFHSSTVGHSPSGGSDITGGGVKTIRTNSKNSNIGYYCYKDSNLVARLTNHGSGPEGIIQLYNQGVPKLSMNGTNGTINLHGSAGYIQFGDTSTDNHRLDDYEHNTINLTLTNSAGGTPNYSYRAGWYTKIGNVVHMGGDLRFGGSWSSNGDMYLTLPFTSYTSGGTSGGGICHEWNTNQGMMGGIFLQIDNNETKAKWIFHNNNGNNNTNNFHSSYVGNGHYLKFTLTYYTHL